MPALSRILAGAYLALAAYPIGGCITPPFEVAQDACPEAFGYASYAYFCSADGTAIEECHAADGALSMCDQAAVAVRTCRCDALTTCNSSTLAVACVHTSPGPDAGPPRN